MFDDSLIHQMNKDLESYIEENNYYEDQKKKSNIDQYFSDLQSGKPQIFGLYWSKTQVNIRQSNELDLVKKWLNSLWTHEHNGETIFDPNNELVYADRVRRREPGDKTLAYHLIVMQVQWSVGLIKVIKMFTKIYLQITLQNMIHLMLLIEIKRKK